MLITTIIIIFTWILLLFTIIIIIFTWIIIIIIFFLISITKDNKNSIIILCNFTLLYLNIFFSINIIFHYNSSCYRSIWCCASYICFNSIWGPALLDRLGYQKHWTLPQVSLWKLYNYSYCYSSAHGHPGVPPLQTSSM